LWPVSQWPIHVYVLRLLSASVIEKEVIETAQTQLIEWGELHRTLAEAVAASQSLLNR
jgi:hypothetical protein